MDDLPGLGLLPGLALADAESPVVDREGGDPGLHEGAGGPVRPLMERAEPLGQHHQGEAPGRGPLGQVQRAAQHGSVRRETNGSDHGCLRSDH
jgi:hypothetical protein